MLGYVQHPESRKAVIASGGTQSQLGTDGFD